MVAKISISNHKTIFSGFFGYAFIPIIVSQCPPRGGPLGVGAAQLGKVSTDTVCHDLYFMVKKKNIYAAGVVAYRRQNRTEP